MRILKELTAADSPTAIALGMFDGVHLGHREVLRRAFSFSPLLTNAVFTFTVDDMPPKTKQNFSQLLSYSRQQALLEDLGCELLFRPPFSSIQNIEPEDFFSLLIRQCGAKAIFCGEDFRFGAGAKGNTAMLKRLSEQEGISFAIVPEVKQEGVTVSSTLIRQKLLLGKVEEANALLASPYSIDEKVTHGRRLGRTLSFPTINQLYPKNALAPKFGVYATVAVIDGKRYPGLTNVGVKPTVGDFEPVSAETHIIGFSGDLYEKPVLLEFYRFIREERRFSSLNALKAQIENDKAAVLQFFSEQIKNGGKPW